MTTVVVGGGMAGALAARALDLAGEDVMVVDTADEAGGIARALDFDGYLLEPAAGSLTLPHPAISPLLEGLDVEILPTEPSARRRFVHHRNRTIEVRPGLGLATSPLVSPAGKARLLAEPFISRGHGEESLESFLTRRLGREAGRLTGWLMAAGVQAGDPAGLSAAAAFPMLAYLEREHGSLLRGYLARRGSRPEVPPSPHVVAGGTARVAQAVARSLGGRWRSSWQVERLEPTARGWRVHGPEAIDSERVIVAVATDGLGRLHPPAVSELPPAPWAPVAVVWLGLAAPRLPEGFGVLVGREERFAALGFLYESSYAPDRAPAGKGLVKAIVGGATNPAAVTLGDDQLVGRVTGELSLVLGSTVEVDISHVVRHDPGIPQYTAARRRMVQRLRESLPPGLDVCGWAYDGVGVAQLAAAAHRLAQPR